MADPPPPVGSPGRLRSGEELPLLAGEAGRGRRGIQGSIKSSDDMLSYVTQIDKLTQIVFAISLPECVIEIFRLKC